MTPVFQALAQLPGTKEQADRFAELLIQEVKGGATDPLRLRVFLKHFEQVIQKFTEQCEQDILREAEKYGTKFQLMDADIQIKINGSKYAYDKTQDPVLQRLQADLEKLTKKVKDREKFLQSLPAEGMEIADDETGELVRVFPPYKAGGKTGLAITIKEVGK